MTDVPGAIATIEAGRTDPAADPEPVLRLAADSPAEIAGQLARLAQAPDQLVEHLERPGHGALLRRPAGDKEKPCRLAVVDPTPKRLATARGVDERGARWSGRGDIWFSPAPLLGPGGGTVGFLFPGLEADFRPRTADVAAWLGLRPPSAAVDTLGRRARAALAFGRAMA